MPEKLELSVFLPSSPESLCGAWLDSEGHSAFTGSEARVDPKVGGVFSAWDGYISGRTLEIDAGKRILQSWRTTDFPEGSPDSMLEIRFKAKKGGTELVLVHTLIPGGQAADYEKGWKDHYFDPMKDWLSRQE